MKKRSRRPLNNDPAVQMDTAFRHSEFERVASALMHVPKKELDEKLRQDKQKKRG